MKKLTHKRTYIQPTCKCLEVELGGLLCKSEGYASGNNGQKGDEGSGNIRNARLQDFFTEDED